MAKGIDGLEGLGVATAKLCVEVRSVPCMLLRPGAQIGMTVHSSSRNVKIPS